MMGQFLFAFLKSLLMLKDYDFLQRQEEDEGGRKQRESSLSVFFGHKALPSDTCH